MTPNLLLFGSLFLVAFAGSISAGKQFLSLPTSNRQSQNPIYFAVRQAGELGSTQTQILYEGFSFCPTDFSSSGATVECVSPLSSAADFYLGTQFISRDNARPFTIQGESAQGFPNPWSFPQGPVTLYCYTDRWYTWVNGVFECGSTSPTEPENPPPPPAASPSTSAAPTPSTSSASAPTPEPWSPPQEESAPAPAPASEQWSPPQEESTSEIEQSSTEFRKRSSSSRPLVDSGSFRKVFPASHILPRRRIGACVAVARGKVYLIGGKGDTYPVSEFNPETSKWVNKESTPFEFYAHQCVAYGSDIYVIGAWYGKNSHEDTWAYNTETESWFKSAPLPNWRLRGSGAAAISGSKIYFAGGSTGGYGWETTLRPYLDVLDLNNVEAGWIAMQDMPDARDHAQGGITSGFFCVGGGRDGSQQNFHAATVSPMNCYNLATENWERRKDLPEPRSDVLVTGTCEGLIMIAGGEGKGMAYDRVDLYDPVRDEFLEPTKMNTRRHGTGLAVSDCSCGNVYTSSGSARQGLGLELNDLEIWSSDGVSRNC